MPGFFKDETSRFGALLGFAKAIGLPLLIFDSETTGFLGMKNPGCVEIGAMHFDPDASRVTQWHSLINPGVPIPAGASRVHGISDHDVRDAPGLVEVWPDLKDWFEGSLISGFNTRRYDVPYLTACLQGSGIGTPMFGLQLDVRDVWAGWTCSGKGKLSEVASHFGVEAKDQHRAMGDVTTSALVLQAMLSEVGAAKLVQHIREPNGRLVVPQSPAPAANRVHGLPLAAARPSTATAMAEKAIMQFVATGQRITPGKVLDIAALTGANPVTLSFALSSLVERRAIPLELVRDEAQQSTFAPLLDRAIIMAGSQYLKPVRSALMALGCSDVDYVQLRVAMLDRAERAEEDAQAEGTRTAPVPH